MLLQLIPGTISFCTNGYGLMKSYTNGDISSMIYHIIYILAIMPIFLTLCSVSDDLLQKNENIKHMLYNLEWYNYNSRTKKFWIMMINHANKSIKITGGGFFVISLKCYKNWFINGVEYLSVLAAIMTRS
ncbi:odorant receptor coreceptor-like [Cotesia glomerata]|uniref:odorant receptor coreceptor-like n=1 Tax=Cotesia glomerata TaxID=32391 RepID=UPI001D020479|nr:odorant receptor coreceptor-like [Cotesia glomerata]